ncbi:hypothetical protein IT418_03730 [bacterium]|nr:hypothetical protein [bacterium]
MEIQYLKLFPIDNFTNLLIKKLQILTGNESSMLRVDEFDDYYLLTGRKFLVSNFLPF